MIRFIQNVCSVVLVNVAASFRACIAATISSAFIEWQESFQIKDVLPLVKGL